MKKVVNFSNGKNVYAKVKGDMETEDQTMTDYDQGKRILKENPIKIDRAKDEIDGIADALKFRKQYQNADDPHHHIGLTAFRNKGFDFVEVAKQCIQNRIASSGSMAPKNASYERDILNAVATTGAESFVADKLKNEIKARWEKWGYSKDDSIISDFTAANKLSTADLCQNRIQAVIDKYNKQLEDRIRNAVPSAAQQRMMDMRNEIDTE